MAQVLREVDDFFMQRSPVHQAAQAISAELHALGIPFAIAGALAANAHGHRRMTDAVALLMTREGLEKFKKARLGLGWVEKFADGRELDSDGLPFISLKTLLELKIASGMTALHRPRDLDDAIRLIQANQLAQD